MFGQPDTPWYNAGRGLKDGKLIDNQTTSTTVRRKEEIYGSTGLS